MNNKLILYATIAMGLMTASCGKDSGPEEPSGMSYQLRAVNTSGSMNQRTTANGLINWTSGYANPREIKFEAKQTDTKIEYKSTNNARIDLFAPVAQSFGGFMLPAGTYKEIELKVKLDKDGPDPALYLAGNYVNNGVVIPVIFRVDEDVQIKSEVKDVTIDNSSTIAAITTLDLASYLHGLTDARMQNAELTNGTIIISRNSNEDLYKIMMKNLSDKRHKCEFKKHKKHK